MKRVILLTLSLLLGISSYAQTEWEIQPSTLKINASNSLDISNVSSNSVTLHNWIAESKENKKQGQNYSTQWNLAAICEWYIQADFVRH